MTDPATEAPSGPPVAEGELAPEEQAVTDEPPAGYWVAAA